MAMLAACQLDTSGQGDASADSGPGAGSRGPTVLSGSSTVAPSTTSIGTGTAQGSTGSASTGAPSGPASETGTTTEPVDPDTASPSTGSSLDASLPMLRIELPCIPGECPYNPDDVCRMSPTVSTSEALEGEPGTLYEVTVRVRGVVEMSTYINGTLDSGGNVYVGGQVDSYWSPFSLVVSDPPQIYWLNPLGDGDLFTHGMDYTYTLPVAAGAIVRLDGGSGDDSCGLFNHDQFGVPIVIPQIDPAPAAFDGQFVQVDAEMIVAME